MVSRFIISKTLYFLETLKYALQSTKFKSINVFHVCSNDCRKYQIYPQAKFLSHPRDLLFASKKKSTNTIYNNNNMLLYFHIHTYYIYDILEAFQIKGAISNNN